VTQEHLEERLAAPRREVRYSLEFDFTQSLDSRTDDILAVEGLKVVKVA